MVDKGFLWVLAGLQVFLGIRLWTTPPDERAIEFMPVAVFALAFILSATAVLAFSLHPSRFWRTVSGGLTVIATAGRAVAVLYAGYHDQIIPVSRAQAGFAAWMLGALLATWVWAHAIPRTR